MNRKLERRAIARLERRRQRLAGQLSALVTPHLQVAILADPELLALVRAPATNPDDPSTWPPELERRGQAAFDAVVTATGAGRLVAEHDRLAARLTDFCLLSEVTTNHDC